MKLLILLLSIILYPLSFAHAQTITSITWSNLRTGQLNQPVSPPLDTWTINNIPLLPGLNPITVTMTDSTGATATDSITVTLTPTFPGNTLAGAWSFDNVTTDSSGNPNTATLLNGAAYITPGKFGAAVQLDGINDTVSIADSNSLDFTQSFTLMAWVLPSTVRTNFSTVIAKNAPGIWFDGWPLQFLYATGNAVTAGGCLPQSVQAGFIADGSLGNFNIICDNTPLTIGIPTHLAVTYDGSNLRLYKNGVPIQTKAATGIMEPSALALQIGDDQFGGSQFGPGWIDEVRVYNYARSLAEIVSDMNTAIIPTVPPLPIKIPASATGLKVGAAAGGLKLGVQP